jgi:pimeloyl-ACP methyl ester carboxylesterase
MLKRKGFSVSNFGYPSREDFIYNHASNLVDVLNSLSSKDTSQFHFVTHSLGAIVLRIALAQPNCPENARTGRLVLLSPPFKGSKFARYLRSKDLGGKLPNWMEITSKWIVGDCTGRQLMTMTAQGMLACKLTNVVNSTF